MAEQNPHSPQWSGTDPAEAAAVAMPNTNGTEPPLFSDEERQFLVALLSHQQVCALLSQPADKQMAASVQAKLSD